MSSRAPAVHPTRSPPAAPARGRPEEPQESQCGWLKDRYGVSWQVVPDGMEAFFADPDTTRVERAMQAMFGMKKLDLAKLKAAFDGEPAS